VLIAHGRDAADVALSNPFGPNTLTSFRVWADEVPTGEVMPPNASTRSVAVTYDWWTAADSLCLTASRSICLLHSRRSFRSSHSPGCSSR
jgi:hypothetical protein